MPPPLPPEPRSLEAVFLANLDLIHRIVAVLVRRNGTHGEDAAELSSWVKLRLVEDDYAILRKFRGESSMATYLTVVITSLLRDDRVRRRGRWRPSAAARKRGKLAMRLEALVHRQGLRLAHAAEMLRTSGATELSDRQLAKLLGELPRRAPLRPVEVGADTLQAMAAASGAESMLEAQHAMLGRERARQALERAIAHLPVADRLMLRMRFLEGMTIADIARGLGAEQKPLYKHLDRVLATLRERLTEDGVTRQEVRDLLENQPA